MKVLNGHNCLLVGWDSAGSLLLCQVVHGPHVSDGQAVHA